MEVNFIYIPDDKKITYRKPDLWDNVCELYHCVARQMKTVKSRDPAFVLFMNENVLILYLLICLEYFCLWQLYRITRAMSLRSLLGMAFY